MGGKKEIRNAKAHDNSVATSYGRNRNTEGRTKGIGFKASPVKDNEEKGG